MAVTYYGGVVLGADSRTSTGASGLPAELSLSPALHRHAGRKLLPRVACRRSVAHTARLRCAPAHPPPALARRLVRGEPRR